MWDEVEHPAVLQICQPMNVLLEALGLFTISFPGEEKPLREKEGERERERVSAEDKTKSFLCLFNLCVLETWQWQQS